jgi:ribonucleoside-diphosphate reductase alpha chain
MGWHSYLQQHAIPFESDEAVKLNTEVFGDIQTKAIIESKLLGGERGEAPDMKGTGLRNAHMLAIAPNANSSLIGGTSPSIEPWKANAFTSRTRVGSHLTKNKYLIEILKKYDRNNEKTWSSIINSGGSVQHFGWMDANVKAVYKTAIEIDQDWVVRQGGERQKHICQGQSLNVFFPAGATKSYLHKVHFDAWRYGCKGLYYLRTETSNRAENVATKVERERLKDFVEINNDECTACHA